jgi:hypothetical protein
MSKFISNFTIVENISNTIDVSNEESNSKSTEYCEFDTAITDDELVLSASPTDSLINQIVEIESLESVISLTGTTFVRGIG